MTGLSASCEAEVVAQLMDVRCSGASVGPEAAGDRAEARFSTEQNARLVRNAEEYYRAMFAGRVESWNRRGTHMMETLEALRAQLRRQGRSAGAAVWAHNSHVGDARATQLGAGGEPNLGQLARERHDRQVCLIGATTYDGTVTAATDWGRRPVATTSCPLPGSHEHLCHEAGTPAFLLDLRAPAVADVLRISRLQRAVGVVYRPRNRTRQSRLSCAPGRPVRPGPAHRSHRGDRAARRLGRRGRRPASVLDVTPADQRPRRPPVRAPCAACRHGPAGPECGPSMARLIRSVAPLALVLALAVPVRAQVAAPATLPAGSAAAEGVVPDRLDRLHGRLTRFVDEGDVAGLVSLIVRNGKVVDVHTAGFRDREQRVPMTRDTIFRIYSMSKIITSVAVLTLVEDGRLRLDDPVGAILPALASPRVFTGGTAAVPQLVPARRAITIRHLLTHTSGFAYGLAPSVVDDMYRDAKLLQARTGDAFIEKLAKLPLISQPGEQFYYGVNTDVLGVIVEKVTGQTLGAYVKARILDPLGMTDTGFDVPAAKRTRLAALYQRQDKGPLTVVPTIAVAGSETSDLPYPDPEGRLFHSGGGGMFSTADDYARFAQMLVNGGTLGDARILGRKTVAMMTSDQNIRIDTPTVGHSGFGLGVSVRRDLAGGALAGSVGEFGWSGAATTLVVMDPQEKTVALLLTQHFPFDQPRLFSVFQAMVNAALR